MGKLTFSMGTYIKQAIERFAMADLSKGLPYRNLVGCLMWIACSVFGTILVRVKELARHCNAYTEKEYQLALKLLHSLDLSTGITFLRGGAYHERVPQLTRRGSEGTNVKTDDALLQDTSEGGVLSPSFEGFSLQSSDIVNEFGEKDLFRVKDDTDRTRKQEEQKTKGERKLLRVFALWHIRTPLLLSMNSNNQYLDGWFTSTGLLSCLVVSDRPWWSILPALQSTLRQAFV